MDGREPDRPEAWGWRKPTVGNFDGWQPQGKRIGWVDGEDVYLDQKASHGAAQALAGDDGIPYGPTTLFKRIKEKGLLASFNGKRHTTRRDIESRKRRRVVHLRAHLFDADRSEDATEDADDSDARPTFGDHLAPADGEVGRSGEDGSSRGERVSDLTGPLGPLGPDIEEKPDF